jgi:hypothetical protein
MEREHCDLDITDHPLESDVLSFLHVLLPIWISQLGKDVGVDPNQVGT